MKKRTRTILLFLQLIFISIPYINQAQNTQISNLSKLILNKKENIISVVQSQSGKVELETFNIDPQNKKLVLNFSSGYTYQPLRLKIIQTQKEKIKSLLGNQFKDYEIILSSMGLPVEVQVPNFYRGSSLPIDSTRLEKRKEGRIPIVKNMSNPFIPPKGLFNRNIALWHSHGWYYDIRANRWDWQRTRLFGTVEDKFTMSFILPYLVPMLENAGANVFLPRERDIQTHEVIVDADKSTDDSEVKFNEKRWTTTNVPGFAIGNPPYSHNENPFRQGTCSQSVSSKEKNSRYEWIPEFPATGDYAVYISYQSLPGSSTSALYKVHHTGGVTEFKVNQQIGGGTWIYLGTFHFEKGKNPDMGRVVLSGKTDQIGEIITADAVRFGGGMGNIARSAKDKWIENQKSSNTDPGNKVIQDVPDSLKADPIVSGRPRFLEGARYYLQYAGMPDSLIYSPEKGMNDYNDDYKSRGFWVNYLTGAPIGPTTTSPIKGLGIPIDLSFALHSDAGITPNDSIIGTLSIFSSEADSGLFYTGQSRWASRDLADIIQTQVVDDIKAKFNPNWTRRGIWNKQYSEAYRPSVPAALLELLSHQNFADMKYGNDPLFKFTVSRAIYKAMTRFIAFQNEDSCIIQPLPVSHFRVTRNSPQSVQLCWRPVVDPLEPTAKAEKYKVYTRIEDNGFDNGVIVNDTTYIISNLKPGVIYSFKIAALNEGGESFPSEILSAALGEKDDNPVLIVNAFDRVSAPATIDTPGYAGFATNLDQGVPDRYDIGYVGEQYDFDRNSTYIGNDNPGFGASYGDMETA
ncbi:MAG: fibronectin type III domain-containing protein, partial [Bacteroidota bacterium]|nr:fibronectin type III domain-containing protein [Bacteroidota bacterium]